MSSRWLRLPGLALGILLLVACAGPGARRDAHEVADAALFAGQAAREAQLAARGEHWLLEGRLAVADGGDSGSGSFEWEQAGASFRFAVQAPVTGRSWVLSGQPGDAELAGLDGGPRQGSDAEALLRRELGWEVPLAELREWVRAMRAPGEARIGFRADGLPAWIEQAGWRIDYPEYDTTREPPLPRRLFARSGRRSVRLAIRRWTLP